MYHRTSGGDPAMLDDRKIQSARDVLLTDALDRLGLRWEIDPSYRPRGNPDTKLVLVNDQFEITITDPLFVLRRRGSRDVIATGRGAITLATAITGCSFKSAVQRLNPPLPVTHGQTR